VRRLRLALILIGSAIMLSTLLLPALASATPVSEKKAEARQIRQQVAALDEKLGAVVEQYNHAREQLDTVKRQITKNTKALKVAEYNLEVARKNLDARVVALYKERPVEMLDVVFSAGSFEEVTSQLDLMERLGEHDSDLVDAVTSYRQEIKEKRKGLVEDRKEATTLVAEVADKKSDIEGRLAERRDMLQGVEAEVRQLERAEEEAARRAAEAAQAAATATGNSGTTQRPIIPGSGGPGHPEVCAIAARYLGVPYRYGGASPSTGFDCSGFVMYVYAQIGMSLPHYSGSQQQMGTPVSMSALAPGDLVFRGNPAYHVGIYVGGGSVIHSPHTGAVVSYQSVSSWTSAVRL